MKIGLAILDFYANRADGLSEFNRPSAGLQMLPEMGICREECQGSKRTAESRSSSISYSGGGGGSSRSKVAPMLS
jgi:hypothetical protein